MRWQIGLSCNVVSSLSDLITSSTQWFCNDFMVFAMIILDWHTRFWLRQGAIIRDLDLDVIAILLHTLLLKVALLHRQHRHTDIQKPGGISTLFLSVVVLRPSRYR